MRVISGSLKGKKIIHLQSSNTRPLKDLVKESIFNIILHSNLFSISLKNSRVFDLYSGIGSFGIECISRIYESNFCRKRQKCFKYFKSKFKKNVNWR